MSCCLATVAVSGGRQGSGGRTDIEQNFKNVVKESMEYQITCIVFSNNILQQMTNGAKSHRKLLGLILGMENGKTFNFEPKNLNYIINKRLH